jgi:hypothetical protein
MLIQLTSQWLNRQKGSDCFCTEGQRLSQDQSVILQKVEGSVKISLFFYMSSKTQITSDCFYFLKLDKLRYNQHHIFHINKITNLIWFVPLTRGIC